VKVEIDISEVEYGDYYKDEKCKEVERVLRSDPQYAECEVKRARWENKSNNDPFYVLDERGEDIITLDRWEVYALSDSELISYIDIQRTRNRVSNRLELVAMSFTATSAFAPVSLILAVAFLYFGEYGSFSVLANLTVLAGILLFVVGILYYSMRRRTSLLMKNMDLEAVRQDRSFLEMLRRLAETPEADEYTRKELVKRVKHIEDALAGISS
jgi:hypothetical protein